MKVFICALLALCLLVTGIACFCVQLDNLCNTLLQKADTLEAEILNENKEDAQKLLSEMQAEWENKTPLLMAFTEHSEINGVTDRLTGIENGLLYNDFAIAYRELSTFKHHISCISQSSVPSIINIL